MADQPLCLLTTRINGEIDLQHHFNRRCIELIQDLCRLEDHNAHLEDLPLEAVDLAELGARPEEGGQLESASNQVGKSLIDLFCQAVFLYHLCFDLF